MINTPFWFAHILFWIAMAIESNVKKDIVETICNYIIAACIGGQIMYIVTELI